MSIFESKRFTTVLLVLSLVGLIAAFFANNITYTNEIKLKDQTYVAETKQLNEKVASLERSINILATKVTQLQSKEQQTQSKLQKAQKALRSLGVDFQ